MWWYIATFLISLVVVSRLTPKSEAIKPAGLSDIDAPTAEVGREIPVLFGTREIKSANVVWYGDLKTVAVKKSGGKK